jgi:hypothetical protein
MFVLEVALVVDGLPIDKPPVKAEHMVIFPSVILLYKFTALVTAVACNVFVVRLVDDNLPVEALNVKLVFVLIFDDPEAVDEKVI